MLGSFDLNAESLVNIEPKCVIAVDYAGRQLIGLATKTEGESFYMDFPMALMEGRDQRTNQIVLQIMPLHSFAYEGFEVRWTTLMNAPKEIERAYNESVQQLRAARSGLVVTNQMPPKR